MSQYRNELLRNAEKITRLHQRIKETFPFRGENNEKLKEWQEACRTFHQEYDKLAFPGGLEGAYERILDGDIYAMEAAICFLECRPYFFRSGYMFKDILRIANRAPLTPDQRTRYQKLRTAFEAYKASRTATE